MTFSETRTHLQSFETKMEFIRPKFTEMWQFEIWKFLKIIRKIEKLMVLEGLTNGGEHENFP